MKPNHILIVLVLASVLASVAKADCVAGTRESTQEEQAYEQKLKASLMAAMPAAPAPLALQYEPRVILQSLCKDTPVGQVNAMVTANYAAGLSYDERVELTVRVNYKYPGATDMVLGTLPKKVSAFKVNNLVIKVDGYKRPYIEAVQQAIDRDRLQALIDRPLPDTPPPAAWTVGAPANNQAKTSTPASGANDTSGTADSVSSTTDKTKDVVNKLRGLFGH